MRKVNLLILFIIILGSTVVNAQKTAIYKNPGARYRDAMELFNKEKYGAARELFKQVIKELNDPKSVITADASYFAAISSLELFNKDAEFELTGFINNYPENTKINQAWFKLGCYQSSTDKQKQAIISFDNVDTYDLSPVQLTEYNFKKGYCYFIATNYDKAKKHLGDVKDGNLKYATPATYYYAHILYMDKNYETALTHFNKLKKDENFGSIVPYYIAQILYMQGKYDELLEVAPPLFKTSTPKRAPELAHLIGEAYYKTNKYKEAIPYFQIYQQKTSSHLTRDDDYQLGYAYYKTEVYDTAIIELQKVCTLEDSLTQNAWYHLGDCYIKIKNKKFARTAFLTAYKNGLDKKIKEDALYNYAKVSYELSINPYNDAIESFQKYLKDYPNSNKIDEIQTYLVSLYLTTKNYKEALKSIESIKKRDSKLNEAYQRIVFNRAVDLFNESKLDEAEVLFKKAIEYDYNESIIALSHYWLAEGYYRNNSYVDAQKSYKKFMVSPGAYSMPEYNLANYNIGYTNFIQKNYSEALVYFKKFLLNRKSEGVKIINDAYLRTADCYFINKEYSNAIDYYNNAIELKQPDADYALYQKALSLGVQGKFEPKINTFLTIINGYKKSTYIAASKYELANTYLIIENNEKALKYYQEIYSDYPKSSYAKDALLKIGLIQRNMRNYTEAIATFKTVISKYPGTSSAKEALATMQNIYVETNKVDEFLDWVKGTPFANSFSVEEKDSMSYVAAENIYFNGDCEKSAPAFGSYITKYPNGAFLVPANFYKAECELKAGNIDNALTSYEYVLAAPKSKFTEKALLNASSITFEKKNYEKAYNYYQRLESDAEYNSNIMTARTGIMRSAAKLNKYDKAMAAANNVLSTPKISNELADESHFIIAKAYMSMDSTMQAQSEFSVLAKSKNGEISAEAKYNLASIQYKLGNYTTSENIIYDFISGSPSSEYWLAKMLILWADIYVKQDNFPQAKATLQSIIDKYEGPDLVAVAKEKLAGVLTLEKQKAEQKKQEQDLKKLKEDEVKINVDGEKKTKDEEKLF